MTPPRQARGLICRCALACLLVLVVPLHAVQGGKLKKVKKEISKKKESLSETRKRIQVENWRLKQENKKEGSALQELQELNGDLAVAENELRTHRHNMKVVEARLRELELLLEKEKAARSRHQEELERRVVSLYRAGPLGALDLLLSARDPAEFLTRSRFLKAMATQNSRLLQETRLSIQRTEKSEKEFLARKEEIGALRDSAKAGQRRVAAQQEKKRRFLISVKKMKNRTQQALEELKHQASDLQGLLDRLHAEQKVLSARPTPRPSSHQPLEAPADPGEASRGSGVGYDGGLGVFASGPMPRSDRSWPVEGKLLSRYGKQRHPDLGIWVFNKGIEIAAALGARFKAVASGRVLYAKAFERMGKMVVLDHGSYCYTVYAHADDLKVSEGQRVEKGMDLGAVGAGPYKDPSLFFEVTIKGKPVDPLSWLKRKTKRRSS